MQEGKLTATIDQTYHDVDFGFPSALCFDPLKSKYLYCKEELIADYAEAFFNPTGF